MRLVTNEEMPFIAGGDDEIVVTGRRLPQVAIDGGGGGGGWSFSFGGAGIGAASAYGMIGGALYQLMEQDSDGDGIPDFLDEQSDEITITASQDQVDAAHAHHDVASAEITIYGALAYGGMGALGFLGWGGVGGAAALAGGQYLEGRLEVSEALTNALADNYYWMDYYEDGNFDGYIQPYDRYGNPQVDSR